MSLESYRALSEDARMRLAASQLQAVAAVQSGVNLSLDQADGETGDFIGPGSPSPETLKRLRDAVKGRQTAVKQALPGRSTKKTKSA